MSRGKWIKRATTVPEDGGTVEIWEIVEQHPDKADRVVCCVGREADVDRMLAGVTGLTSFLRACRCAGRVN